MRANPFERIITGVGVLAMIASVALPLFFYSILPDVIPKHYDLSGEVDGFGKKWMVWIGPIVGTILYFGLSILSRRPDLFGYPMRINSKNQEYQYLLAKKMIKVLRTLMACMVAYMTYAKIKTALGGMTGLGRWYIVFGFAICGILGIYLYNL